MRMLFKVLLHRMVRFAFLQSVHSCWLVLELHQAMEVEAPETKGHRAFAKPLKPFSSSERHKQSKRLVRLTCVKFFFSFSCGSAGKDAQNVIKRFLNGSYFEEIYGADALRSSGKTIVLPKPVKFPLFSSALSHYYTENARFLAIQIM